MNVLKWFVNTNRKPISHSNNNVLAYAEIVRMNLGFEIVTHFFWSLQMKGFGVFTMTM